MQSFKDQKLDSTMLVLLLLTILAIVAGIYFRFLGLGKWCLTVDEFYMAQSVKNIIEKGIPAFDNGGLYMRGVLFQYISAAVAKIWEFNEGNLRSVSVIFNILSLPALYMLCKKIGGRTLALLTLSIFSVSIWEVEFSRFFRMYTAFQCIFLYFLYFLIRELNEASTTNKIFLITLTILGMFTHAAALFMFLLLFIPLLYQVKKKQELNYLYLIISVALFIFFYAFRQIDFLHLNDPTPPLPSGFIIERSLPVHWPNVTLLRSVTIYPPWLVLFSLMAILCFSWSVYILRNGNFNNEKKICFSMLLFTAIIQQFSMCFLLFPLFIFLGSITGANLKESNSLKLFSFIILFFIFWISFGFYSEGLNNTLFYAAKETARILFGFPNLLVFYSFPFTIPRFTFIAIISITLSLIFKLSSKTKEEYNTLMFIFLYIVFFYGIISTYYEGLTRYFFFMFPILIMIIVHSFIALLKFIQISKKSLHLCCIAFVPIFLIYSDDFNLYHLIHIDQKEVNFRQIFNKRQATHYYQRWDFKTPAQFVNTYRDKNDLVIIDIYPPAYHLKDFNYFFRDMSTGGYFQTISIERGTKEIWRAKPLIHSLDQLTDIIRTSKNTLWFIQSYKHFKSYDTLDQNILNLFNQNEVYTSIDGSLRVIKLATEDVKRSFKITDNK